MSKKSKNSTSKSSLVLLKSSKVDNEAPVLKTSVVKAPSAEASISEIVTSSMLLKADPLSAVADIPEKIASENLSVIIPARVETGPLEAAAAVPKVEATAQSPWDHPTKLFEMAETNTKFISHFVGRFAEAKSTEDLLTVGSEFSREGGLLFKKQSNAILKMFTL